MDDREYTNPGEAYASAIPEHECPGPGLCSYPAGFFFTSV